VAERFELDDETAARLRRAHANGGRIIANGGRIIAVGTSVTRALEAASLSGTLRAGREHTDLRLGPTSVLRSCDGLLTGLHEPGTSHFALLEAFAPRALLERSFRHAQRRGYLQHAFGDSCLILKGALNVSAARLRSRQWRQVSSVGDMLSANSLASSKVFIHETPPYGCLERAVRICPERKPSRRLRRPRSDST